MESLALVLPPVPASMPNWFGELRATVLNGVVSANSKRNYAKALDELQRFCEVQQRPLSRGLLLEFRASMLERELSASTINVKLSAIRNLINEAKRADVWREPRRPSQMADIPNLQKQGTRLENWLTREQAKEMLAVLDHRARADGLLPISAAKADASARSRCRSGSSRASTPGFQPRRSRGTGCCSQCRRPGS
jgi:hypothetical protein